MQKKITDLIMPFPQERTLYITIGNTLLGDDGVGPYIAQKITYKQNNIKIMNAANKPENIIEEAIAYHPAKTVIFDSADFGGTPGEIRVIEETNLRENPLSTHRFPIQAIARIIADDTGSKVFIIGIQPTRTTPGTQLSESVQKSADNIIQTIQKEISNA